MSYVGYLFFRMVVSIFGWLSFGALYKVSDFLAWFLYSVMGYRKKVVIKQLTDSFPNKSKEEILDIAKATYTNLADVIVESLKGFTLTKEQYLERYVITNPEISNNLTMNGQSVIHIAAHYANWEWGAMTYPLWIKSPVLGFYKPMSNPYIEVYGKAKRGRFDMGLIPIGVTAKAFDDYRDKQTTFVFVSDQSTWSDKAHWVTFLGQDTACPPGADKYAHMLNCPVFFLDTKRVKRGYYTVTLELLALNCNGRDEGDITKIYMERVEKMILAKPENWLWSHKRWKKKRNVTQQ